MLQAVGVSYIGYCEKCTDVHVYVYTDKILNSSQPIKAVSMKFLRNPTKIVFSLIITRKKYQCSEIIELRLSEIL